MKGVIDILGMVLPLLLLIIFFIRKRSGLINAIGILLIIVLLLAGIARYLFFSGSKSSHSDEPEPVPLTVSKHSEVFNKSVQAMLDAYYNMSEAFVNWDTDAVNKNAAKLKEALENLNVQELQKDSTSDGALIYQTALSYVSNVSNETSSLLQAESIDKKREVLNTLSDDLRLLLITVKYDQGKLYWQECPMAFGDDQPGNWLSKTSMVRNPYLGLKDPKYKDEMLDCGGPKDTINFMITDTITK